MNPFALDILLSYPMDKNVCMAVCQFQALGQGQLLKWHSNKIKEVQSLNDLIQQSWGFTSKDMWLCKFECVESYSWIDIW